MLCRNFRRNFPAFGGGGANFGCISQLTPADLGLEALLQQAGESSQGGEDAGSSRRKKKRKRERERDSASSSDSSSSDESDGFLPEPSGGYRDPHAGGAGAGGCAAPAAAQWRKLWESGKHTQSRHNVIT